MTDLAIRPLVRPDVSAAAATLAHLLTLHPELTGYPFRWELDRDAVIRPCIEVDDPQAQPASYALAAALELEVDPYTWTGLDGADHLTLRVEGRWGGATWIAVTYTRGGGQ